MLTYYMLECLSRGTERKATVDFRDPDRDRLWMSGERLQNPPEGPLEAELKLRRDSVLMEMWKVPLPIMSKRLHAALQEAGVANLEVFPIRLRDRSSGEVYDDYLAFNVVGKIAAANLDASRYSAPDGLMTSVDFDSVVIDTSSTRGALMFRLAESVNGIVVHADVKTCIERAGIDTLTFVDPSQWAS